MSHRPSMHRLRRAVTLIEVVFSIGVVLIGLLGLLSILPLAGRRAQDSISLSVGPKLGERVISSLQAKRFLSSGRLMRVPPTTAVPVTVLPVATPEPFCIDPMFASSTVSTLPSTVPNNGYTPSLFPYYRQRHSPVEDPSTQPMSPTWVAQPRMLRVGVARQQQLPPPAQPAFISVGEAFAIAENPDDLILTRPEDRSIGASLQEGQVQATGGGLEYGIRIPSGDFTWFATVNPLPGGVYASVAVVVVKKRERSFDAPTVDNTPPSEPSGNAVGERLAYVTYGSGFSGGAGGIVHVVSNANTISRIRSDDWVMLSRNLNGTAVDPDSSQPGPFWHRWYRVVSANGKAEEFEIDGSNTVNDSNLGARFPSSSIKVWRHKLLLDGPDWQFGFVDGSTGLPRDYADATYADNTYATIVEGVVSVVERVVLLSEL